MQGGASTQFALVPMNLRTDTHAGDYVITDAWGKKAYDEAKIVGKPQRGLGREQGRRLDARAEAERAQAHAPTRRTCTSPATTRSWARSSSTFPNTGNVPLVVDMSSDILWRPIDVSKFGLIYAGAQKNMGPAGITVVIIRKDLIEKGRTDLADDLPLRGDRQEQQPAQHDHHVRGVHGPQRAAVAEGRRRRGRDREAQPQEGRAPVRRDRRLGRLLQGRRPRRTRAR